MPEEPAYLRIAAALRTRITSGELAPGAKLPSETAIMRSYSVSRTVAKWAIAVLKSEGSVEGRAGSGVYVRSGRRLTRESPARNSQAGSPFAYDADLAGQAARWEHESTEEQANEEVATRLRLDAGAPVMLTRYRFFSGDQVIQISSSWEPLELTGGTPIRLPEASPATGVVARMKLIGVDVDEVEERVITRAARPDEATALGLQGRTAPIIAIRRTYVASKRPIETADIVLPSERYELVYRLPVT